MTNARQQKKKEEGQKAKRKVRKETYIFKHYALNRLVREFCDHRGIATYVQPRARKFIGAIVHEMGKRILLEASDLVRVSKKTTINFETVISAIKVVYKNTDLIDDAQLYATDIYKQYRDNQLVNATVNFLKANTETLADVLKEIRNSVQQYSLITDEKMHTFLNKQKLKTMISREHRMGMGAVIALSSFLFFFTDDILRQCHKEVITTKDKVKKDHIRLENVRDYLQEFGCAFVQHETRSLVQNKTRLPENINPALKAKKKEKKK